MALEMLVPRAGVVQRTLLGVDGDDDDGEASC